MRNSIGRLIFTILVAVTPWSEQALSQEETYTILVRHDHDPWGACTGELAFSNTGIEFRSSRTEHQRRWSWQDIQTVDRHSSEAVSILTWEDSRWQLWQDRYFDFKVPLGGDPLPEEAFDLVRRHLKRPLVDRKAGSLGSVLYEVGVKHRHALGGCEGRLRFTKEQIVFESDDPDHTRSWNRGRDVQSIWSPHQYALEIHTFEENRKSFQKTKRFRFQLKEALDQTFYFELRKELVNLPDGR